VGRAGRLSSAGATENQVVLSCFELQMAMHEAHQPAAAVYDRRLQKKHATFEE
jgi:hypothetical protein